MTGPIDNDAGGAEERLFAIAKRWRMPLERLPGDDMHALAERLSLAIEHQIAIQLMHLQEITELDLDEETGP